MLSRMAEMDPIAKKCVAACWPLVAGLVARVRVMLAEAALNGTDGFVPRSVFFRALQIIRPAEAMVRRMLYLIATEISVSYTLRDIIQRAAPKPDSAPPTETKSDAPQTQAPGRLALAEPLLPGMPGPERPVYGPAPSIWLYGTPREPEPEGPAEDLSAASLLKRLARLEASCASPQDEARRLALWQARRRAEMKGGRGPRRTHPLRMGRPPGYQRRGGDPIVRRRLKDLWCFCHWADNLPIGPPGMAGAA